MAKKARRKRPANAPAAQTAPKAAPDASKPDALPWPVRLMGALSYLSVAMLIPALSRHRHDPFVSFHLNQGLILLMLGTVCGALSLAPYLGEAGFYLGLLVDMVSLAGMVQALRGQRTALPLVSRFTRNFHPFV